MKRTTKAVGTLSIALVMTSAFSPIYASIDQETLIEEKNSVIYETISVTSNIDKLNYLSFEGVIQKIESKEGYLSVSLKNAIEEGYEEAVFNISDDVLIIDQGTKDKAEKDGLKEGQKISGYYRKDMPMLMIYPPMINPELVIIKDEEAKDFIKHSNFNEDWISADESLKLNVSDEIVITNQLGETLSKEELYNEDLIVFFTTTTRSIPAQTNPSKIIVLEKQLEEDSIISETDETDEVSEIDKIDEIINDDSYNKDGVIMVPIRKIAEYMGYELEWNNVDRSIILKVDNKSFLISIGKEEYGFNRSLGKFEKAPEISNDKTYVPQSFIDILK